MTQVYLKGTPVKLSGSFPALHTQAPSFSLTDHNLQDKTLNDFHHQRILIATVPSLDTEVCSKETKHLNQFAKQHSRHVIVIVSCDLPFAQKRFCAREEVANVQTLSMMRNKEFGRDYGILIENGPLSGLLARAVFILDDKGRFVYTELVPEITKEPDYHKALTLL